MATCGQSLKEKEVEANVEASERRKNEDDIVKHECAGSRVMKGKKKKVD